jgi:hypothetical protein
MRDLSPLARLALAPVTLAALGLSMMFAPAVHASDTVTTDASTASASDPDSVSVMSGFSLVKPKVFSFENGKTSGWKGTGGAESTVETGSARTGTYSLVATGLGVAPGALSWSRPLSAFPGDGSWYRLQVPLKVVSGEAGMVWIRMRGAADLAATAVTVDSSGWSIAEAWFQPEAGATSVAFTLEQAPQTDCGPATGPLGTVSLDDVTLSRADDLPDAAVPVVDDGAAEEPAPGEPATDVIPFCGIG